MGTGTIDSKTYYFDFSKLPHCKYRGTFSCITSAHTTTASCANLYIDLGQDISYPVMGATGNQFSNGYFFLGNLGATAIATNSYLYCDNTTNPPFYLMNKPCNNQITVKLLLNDANPPSNYPTDCKYTLTISLECLE